MEKIRLSDIALVVVAVFIIIGFFQQGSTNATVEQILARQMSAYTVDKADVDYNRVKAIVNTAITELEKKDVELVGKLKGIDGKLLTKDQLNKALDELRCEMDLQPIKAQFELCLDGKSLAEQLASKRLDIISQKDVLLGEAEGTMKTYKVEFDKMNEAYAALQNKTRKNWSLVLGIGYAYIDNEFKLVPTATIGYKIFDIL